MTTLSYVSTKGGVGKSTLSWITACSLAHDYSRRVCIVDADLQLSLFKNASVQENLPFSVIPASLPEIYEKVKSLNSDFDTIIIDMPGFLHTPDGSRKEITEFLFFVDVMLLPLKVHDFDALNLLDFSSIVAEVSKVRQKEFGLDPNVAWFFNDLHGRKEIRQMERLLEQNKLPVLGRNLSRSVFYERAIRTSESLLTSSSTPAKIKNEFRLFMDQIIKLL
ncbi:cellulose biosynthesis protein BcsQ [Marinilabilia salmonicolor]|jgi:cellulose biosynthesis protein BcsQ|uniref:ParA family protein n=1 Tax=Marinilabilia salmonicolor TaxID=989 RepID=UPI000D085808|nr:ParA family protein [Marinilabilia salmonicolor]PRY91877.1 cellulose biosynthesis protein BcsQ [Marinilabilia salmonicolor]